MNELLITDTDFRLYCPIANNVDFERFISSVLKAQRGEIRQYLGKALYRDLHVNQEDANYLALLAGGSYTSVEGTVDFFGLKPAIVFYAYAHFLNDNDLRVTRTGNKIQQSDVSEQATPEMIQSEYTKAYNSGMAYLYETGAFLDASTSYPLWKGRQGRPTGGTVITTVTHREFGRNGTINPLKRFNYGD